jgi:hypothetical protein
VLEKYSLMLGFIIVKTRLRHSVLDCFGLIKEVLNQMSLYLAMSNLLGPESKVASVVTVPIL